MPPESPDERIDVVVRTASQHRALAHPLRHRLLIELGERPATISQLARALGVRKGSVAHHLGVLTEAAFVAPGERRPVRGGTEQYFVRIARRIVGDDAPESSAAMLAAVADDVRNSVGTPLLHLRYLRLTDAAAAELRATLDRLVGELTEAAEGEPRHGVLVGVFQRPGG